MAYVGGIISFIGRKESLACGDSLFSLVLLLPLLLRISI